MAEVQRIGLLGGLRIICDIINDERYENVVPISSSIAASFRLHLRLYSGSEGRAGYSRGGWDDNGWGIGIPNQPERRHLG